MLIKRMALLALVLLCPLIANAQDNLKMSFAVSAVIKWKLQPYVVNGKAKKVSGIVTVHFPPESG